ncbi:hypothetical protein ACFC26_37625 [Kitasatospora purpeofusca]|uniref:hypothetical protein n=1 Tax=Kitasatospora purpeofusca TaxID=67352 RepID=UPI0035DE1226
MRIRLAAVALSVTATSFVAFAPAAHAEPPSSRCLVLAPAQQAFCYFYNSGQNGAVRGWDTTNFAGYSNIDNAPGDTAYFVLGSGAGSGLRVKNHAGSATYQRPGQCSGYVRSYYNSGWSGAYDQIEACSGKNLQATHDQNASFLKFN